MIKKVSIDELDFQEPSVIMEREVDQEDELQKTSSVKRNLFCMLIISGAVFLLLVLLGTLLLWWIPVGKKEAPLPASHAVADRAASTRPVSVQPQSGSIQSSSITPDSIPTGAAKTAAIAPVGTVKEEIRDFLVPLKDEGGHQRMLVFSLVLEINAAEKERLKEKMVLVRSSIYKVVNTTEEDIAIGKNGMTHMREKIGADLETVLGRGFVKQLLFSKYIVL